MNSNDKKRLLKKAFTLAEVLAALAIGSIVMVTTLTVFFSAQKAADSVNRNFSDYTIPQEALQRIAEDLDSIISDEKNTTITLKNKFDHGYKTARLIISQSYYDKKNNNTNFKKITWQTAYDFDGNSDAMILYRSYTGIPMEDRLLDEEKEKWEKELFVPLCQNVTYFSIQAVKGEELLDTWNGKNLPKAVLVTISFAETFKTPENTLDVPDDQKIYRTIAIDRTRKIAFKIEFQNNNTYIEHD